MKFISVICKDTGKRACIPVEKIHCITDNEEDLAIIVTDGETLSFETAHSTEDIVKSICSIKRAGEENIFTYSDK
jgi:hypothetical protein